MQQRYIECRGKRRRVKIREQAEERSKARADDSIIRQPAWP